MKSHNFSNIKESFWNRKIPGLFGLILTIVGVGVTVYLVRQGIIFLTQASPSEIPQNVKITNVSDTSFTITYTTDDSVVGSVNLGTNDDSEQTVLDDRDQLNQSLLSYETHSITVGNLIPDQNYKYSILSGTNKIIDGEVLFEIKTAPAIESPPPNQEPLAGKVITQSGEPALNTLAYLSTEGSQTISTITKSDGSYILPLNSLRSENQIFYYNFDEESVLNLFLTNGKESSSVTLSLKQINPVPIVTLSNNYDFRVNKDPISSVSALPTQNFPESDIQESRADLLIENPGQGETFIDDQPEFTGSAQPNAEVEIEIHSDENLKTKVAADQSGNWEFRPSEPLSPGEHTITIKTRDSSGILKSITRRFTVFAAGSQVSESATPSGALTPSSSPTLSPSPSPTPTVAAEGSLTATPAPTIAPTGGQTTVVAAVTGAALAIFGIVVFVFTRYKIPL